MCKKIYTHIYWGAASFEDIYPRNKVYSERRIETYRYSKNHFFKLLSESELKNSHFTLMRNVASDARSQFGQERWFKVIKAQKDEFVCNIVIKSGIKDRDGISSILV